MKRWGLFLLRVTTGWLLVLWGIDKFQDVAHGQAVAQGLERRVLFLECLQRRAGRQGVGRGVAGLHPPVERSMEAADFAAQRRG